jgi:hypothetical protein
MTRALKRSWQPGGAHYERFRNRPVDADTVRARALHDRMGSVAALPDVTIRHSLRRTDAYDVMQGNRVVVSGGRVVIGRYLASLLP